MNLFIAIDGNSTGRILENYIFNSKLEELSVFSNSVKRRINTLEEKIIDLNGTVIMCGGDNILAFISSEQIKGIIQCVYSLSDELTFSIGIGKEPIDCYLALKYAKCSIEKICIKDQGFKTFSYNYFCGETEIR